MIKEINNFTSSHISVIIPVFNAEEFIEQTVDSVLSQKEVTEVILAEDGSTDDSAQICRRLSEKSSRVIFCQHPGGRNKGIAATRNLGILNSTTPLIAFLDSDDYYLPDAFKTAVDMLQNPDIDGVYGIVQVIHVNSDGTLVENDSPSFIGIMEYVSPNDLFTELINGKLNSFHANALVIRRSLLEKTGLFDEGLILKEDVELWVRMAAMGNLVPANLEQPVAVHRMYTHSSMNRFSHVLPAMNKKYRLGLLKWLKTNLPRDAEKIRLVETRVAAEYYKNDDLSLLLRPLRGVGVLCFLAWKHQRMVFNLDVWKIAIKYMFPFLFKNQGSRGRIEEKRHIDQ